MLFCLSKSPGIEKGKYECILVISVSYWESRQKKNPALTANFSLLILLKAFPMILIKLEILLLVGSMSVVDVSRYYTYCLWHLDPAITH